MLGNKKDEGLLQKLGFHEYNHNPNGKEKEKIRKSNINTNSNDDLVRFLKPTSSIPNLYAIGKKGFCCNKFLKGILVITFPFLPLFFCRKIFQRLEQNYAR